MNKITTQFPPDLTKIYTKDLANQLANTQYAIGSLNQMSRLLLEPSLLMRPIIIKEAESSSQLEGTQASVDDAYKLDLDGEGLERKDDATEIVNYENAMYSGLDAIKKVGIKNITVREIHKTLMAGVRGSKKKPGEYRKREVWIGDLGTTIEEARYVAPDPTQVEPLMDELITYLNNYQDTHPLIACGLMHHRFEAIHPFEDGNGRTGRLLISLFLIHQGILDQPILYPSGYFEKNKKNYINTLQKVDEIADWYSWIMFFLKALENQAKVALETGLKIDSLLKQARSKIENEKAFISLIRVLEHSFKKAYISVPLLHKDLNLPTTSGARYLELLAERGILEDIGVRNKVRVYKNAKLINILSNI